MGEPKLVGQRLKAGTTLNPVYRSIDFALRQPLEVVQSQVADR